LNPPNRLFTGDTKKFLLQSRVTSRFGACRRRLRPVSMMFMTNEIKVSIHLRRRRPGG